MNLGREVTVGRAVAGGQGAYYLLTGLWPLVSLGTFYAVTGPKRDGWLVQTVGSMIASIGSALLLSARRQRPPGELLWLGASSAAALAAVDVVFVQRGRIRRIYLADAIVELGLLAGWAIAGREGWRTRQSDRRSEKASWTASGKIS